MQESELAESDGATAVATSQDTPTSTVRNVRRWLSELSRERRFEIAALLAAVAMALVVRVVKLGSLPGIITADEADNLQTAYHVMEGTGPGLFGFDWKPAPIFSMYPLAWTIEIFGNSVAAFRLFPALTSVVAIGAFYLVARRVLSPFPALAALVLLSTNLMFLHFSRTAWENVNAALFALGACYATQRALDEPGGREWTKWWSISGVFVALGMYGYFTGRFIFLSVALITVLAVALGRTSMRSAFTGLALAAGVTTVLFLPMALSILENWDVFTRRTGVVSVFGIPEGQTYEGETNGWVIAGKNVIRNYEGFILHDGSEMNRGLWGRYNPVSRAPLGFIAKHLFWGGLLVSLVVWRKTYAWWTFFIPLFIAEVFSTGTPDVARGVIIVPFYFLFIGLLFHEVRNALTSPRARNLVTVAIVGIVALVGSMSVNDYFDWQNNDDTQRSRLPGVAACEFELWSGLAQDAAKAGNGLIDNGAFDEQRRELACSPLINEWLPPPPE